MTVYTLVNAVTNKTQFQRFLSTLAAESKSYLTLRRRTRTGLSTLSVYA